MSQGGKNPGLNILNPNVLVDAEMLTNGVKTDEEAGNQGGVDNLMEKVGLDMNSQNEGK